ncbi:hypothetical protein [Luteipulveratus mongoliensis]|uniref:Lipoprotein n=1 Tax=Luteipulveratus mongoliensis TaxID=571913 RepID=A0A0K1JHH8_9MICO|nr:hypothetical protein [Luteipulveratus mongoliensis]AKU16045.1 hypothetical protein VV02_09550 [Luteipulveratus mongoliensis]
MNTVARALLGPALAVLMLSACSTDPDLPDRSDPQVVRQTSALKAQLTAESMGFGTKTEQWSCAVRLLGYREGDALGWASCMGRTGAHKQGSSGPVRVSPAGVVRQPQDGNAYATSVRQMFGDELGGWVLDHRDELAKDAV